MMTRCANRFVLRYHYKMSGRERSIYQSLKAVNQSFNRRKRWTYYCILFYLYAKIQYIVVRFPGFEPTEKYAKNFKKCLHFNALYGIILKRAYGQRGIYAQKSIAR